MKRLAIIATFVAATLPAAAQAPSPVTWSIQKAPASAQAGQTIANPVPLNDYRQAKIGELIYWPRSRGGTVVNVGTIQSGRALLTDTAFAGFVRNVLKDFGV